MDQSQDPSATPEPSSEMLDQKQDQAINKVHLWASHGLEAVYFQRESLVNFWTILGGIAAGALLTQLAPLVREIASGRWYLVFFFLGSFLTIVNSWVQSVWGSLVLRWRISIPSTLVFFGGLFCLSIQSLMVINPAGWMLATMGVVLFAILVQINFSKSGARLVLPVELTSGYKPVLWLYGIYCLLCLAGAIHLYWADSVSAEIGWGVFALVNSVIALVIQHKGMEKERRVLNIP